MKKFFRWSSIFAYICIFLSILTVNSYAEFNVFLSDIERETGTFAAGIGKETNLSDIGIGTVIQAKVIDPSKLGGCKAGDQVELKKIENDKWTVKHILTDSIITFSVKIDGSDLVIAKIDTSTEKELRSGYKSNTYGKSHYFAFKVGMYVPTDDLEDFNSGFDSEFDSGLNGEIVFNQYLMKNFAVELGAGYFQTDFSESGYFLNIPYSMDIDIYAIPLTANIKGVVPFRIGEFYIGGGVGAYFVKADLNVNVRGYGSYSADDDDFIIGAQFLSGLVFNITDTAFIGVEGKYIFTDDAKMSDPTIGTVEFNLNGFTLSGVFGFRF